MCVCVFVYVYPSKGTVVVVLLTLVRVRTHTHICLEIQIYRVKSSDARTHVLWGPPPIVCLWRMIGSPHVAAESFSLSRMIVVNTLPRARSRQSPAGQVTTGAGIRTAFWHVSFPARPVR